MAKTTYDEAINNCARESAETLFALYDSEISFDDFKAIVKGTSAWDMKLEIPGMDKEDIMYNVVSRIPGFFIRRLKPVPDGEM